MTERAIAGLIIGIVAVLVTLSDEGGICTLVCIIAMCIILLGC